MDLFGVGLLPCESIVDLLCTVDLFHFAHTSRRGRFLAAAALRRRAPANVSFSIYASLARDVYTHLDSIVHYRRTAHRVWWFNSARYALKNCLLHDCIDLVAELDALACFDGRDLRIDEKDLCKYSARAFLFLTNVLGFALADATTKRDVIFGALRFDNYDLISIVLQKTPHMHLDLSLFFQSQQKLENLVLDIIDDDQRNTALIRRVLFLLQNVSMERNALTLFRCFENVCALWRPSRQAFDTKDNALWHELIKVCKITPALLKDCLLGDAACFGQVYLLSMLDGVSCN